MIKKIKGGYKVVSRKGKSLLKGPVNLKKAKKRIAQVEYFNS